MQQQQVLQPLVAGLVAGRVRPGLHHQLGSSAVAASSLTRAPPGTQLEAYGRDVVSPLTPSPSPAMEEFTFGSPAMEPTMDEGEKVIQYRVSSVSSTWRPPLTPYLVTHVSLLVRTINLDTTVLVGAVIIYFRYSIIIVSVGWMTVLLVCCVAILVIIAIVITTVYIISYRQRQKKKHNFGIKKFKSSVRLDNIMDKNANGVSL